MRRNALGLLALLACALGASAAKHSFMQNEKIRLWANKGECCPVRQRGWGPSADREQLAAPAGADGG